MVEKSILSSCLKLLLLRAGLRDCLAEKVRQPKALSWWSGTDRWCRLAERRWRWLAISETGVQQLVRYLGALLCRQRYTVTQVKTLDIGYVQERQASADRHAGIVTNRDHTYVYQWRDVLQRSVDVASCQTLVIWRVWHYSNPRVMQWRHGWASLWSPRNMRIREKCSIKLM